MPRAVLPRNFIQGTAKLVFVGLVDEPGRIPALLPEAQHLLRKEAMRLKPPDHAQNAAAVAKSDIVVGVLVCHGAVATPHDTERLARARAHEEIGGERLGEQAILRGRMDLAMPTDFRLTRKRLATKLREK
jgi:hypothetical protein